MRTLLTVFPGWPKVARSNLSNLQPHPDPTKHGQYLKGDGTFGTPAGGGGGSGDSNREEIDTGTPHGFSAKQAVYNNNGTWTLAKADSLSTARVTAWIESVTTTTFVAVYSGHGVASGWAANTQYYLSDVTAGLLVTTPPDPTTRPNSFSVAVARTGAATDVYVSIGDPLSNSLIPASDIDLDIDATMAANSDARIASQKATKTAIANAIAALLNSAPGALDTLKELADALGDDANFAATVTTALAGKEPAQTTVTQAEAEAGTLTTVKRWTPERVKQAILALAPSGGGGGSSGASGFWYDVKATYFASGSSTTTTGSITSGTNSLVVASASTFVVGQGILIKGAGASGVHLVKIISAISGTTITLSGNAGTTVSGAVVQHDDSAAINAALADCYNAGGGTVFFQSGHYRCNAPVNSTTNSILTFPQNYTYNVPLRINLVGTACGWLNSDSSAIVDGGVTIDSTDAPAVSGNYPAIIAAAPWAVEGFTAFNHMDFFINGIQIVAANNPAICGIMMSNAEQASIGDNVAVYALSVAGFFAQPTAGGVGIFMPQINNRVANNVGECFVAGWTIGIVATEHCVLWRPAIGLCDTGLYCYRGQHIISGYVSIELCRKMIEIDQTYAFQAIRLFLQGEIANPGSWYSTGPGNGLVDPGNKACGFLSYRIAGNRRLLPVSGAGYVDITNDSESTGKITGAAPWAKYNLSDVNDATAGAYNLTNYNSVTFSAGKFGNAAVFNGTNQVLYHSTLDFGGDNFTVCGWFKAANAAVGGLVTQWANATFRWGLYMDASNKLVLNIYNASSAAVTATTVEAAVAPNTTWQFFTAQYNAAFGTCRVKLNDGAWAVAACGPMNAAGALPWLVLGGDRSAASDGVANLLNGSLDAIEFYKVCLSDEHIRSIYNRGFE